MIANTEKIKICFRAVGTFLKNGLSMCIPLWLCIVAFLAAVLFGFTVSCTAAKSSVQTALVGVSEYRGHTFLVFRAMDNTNGTFSVVHDPDCRCNFVELLPSDLDL